MLQKSADTRKKLQPLKPILALPKADPFEIPDFDLGHPVVVHQGTFSSCFKTNRQNFDNCNSFVIKLNSQNFRE